MINIEKYTTKARTLAQRALRDRVSYSVRSACKTAVEVGMPEAEKEFEEKCEDVVRDKLEEYLEGYGYGTTYTRQRRYDYSCGIIRTRVIESHCSIPPELLDVRALVPDFPQLVAALLAEAKKERMIEEIKAVTLSQ